TARCAQRVSLHALIICSAGKKHRRQRRITASADCTRAALSLARGGSACPRSCSSENRLDDLFGKSARTFCRYLHRGPSRTCPILSHDLSSLSREAARSGRSPAPKGGNRCLLLKVYRTYRSRRRGQKTWTRLP